MTAPQLIAGRMVRAFFACWLGLAAPILNAADLKPNCTLPTVAPPTAGLAFSARPTADEIFRARVFEEPLVRVGGKPSAEDNAALAVALLTYAKRNGPDDFSGLTAFLEMRPDTPWRAALLTGLGLEYYSTAYYSRALKAWQEAWALAQTATYAKGIH